MRNQVIRYTNFAVVNTDVALGPILLFSFGVVVRGPPIRDGLLADQGVTDGTTLCFKDLGVQISWRLVFVLEYAGPLIIMPLLWFFPRVFYPSYADLPLHRSRTQMCVCVCVCGGGGDDAF